MQEFQNTSWDSIALETWLDRYFNSKQQADASVSGLSSDFDRDGCPTLLESVTASDPTRFDPSPALLFEAGENLPILIITTQAELVSACLEIQASDDLVHWAPVESAWTALPATLDLDNKTRTTRYVLNPSAIDAGALFFRLVATQLSIDHESTMPSLPGRMDGCCAMVPVGSERCPFRGVRVGTGLDGARP